LKKEKCSFLKKRTKKLLFRCRGLPNSTRQNSKSFLLLFFKKEDSFLEALTMQDIDVATILHGTMLTTLKMCAPLLLASLVTGLVVAVMQAVTQISDSTVSFLPKMISTGGAAWLAGPFLSRTLTDYWHSVMDQLVSVGGQ
jgi:flagellar biosynthetic protein FliQ